jgi:uracil-DNA glycosylase
MFEGIEDQFGESSYNINLKRWTDQGIFLLNTILTVEKNRPLSHANMGWQQFTKFTLEQLKQKKLVWILMGAEAQKLEKIASRNHLVIKTEHPAAASYGERAWRHNDCFIKANEYLKEEIKW